LEDGGACGLAGEVLRGFAAFEKVEGDTSAAAGCAARGAAKAIGSSRVFRDDGDVEPCQRLRVAGEGAVGCGDQDAAQFVVDGSANLRDARIEVARGLVGALDELEFGGNFRVRGGSGDGVERRCRGFGKSLHTLGLRAIRDQRGGPCGLEQALWREVVGVREPGALAGQHADSTANADALRGGLDDAFVHAERHGGNCLKVKVSELATSRKRLSEAALEQPLGQAEMRKEVSFVVRGFGMDKVWSGCH